jgi:SAM-dependent methyltransferase
MTPDEGPRDPQTWHYGVIARWWAEFNVSGPEIAYFQKFIEADGQPALDVACGTGRLLVPYLRAGLDVDGCDISPDMLALCRERAEREGLSPTLYAQAMHQLDLPRRYKTIIVCGSFGLGGNRAHDLEALRRLHEHLEPGGVLVLDNEVPYADARLWGYWSKEKRGTLPELFRLPGERRGASDGTEYELHSRVVDVEPLSQRATLAMRASIWRDGLLIAEEERVLQMTVYFTNELQLMLESAGFEDVVVRGDYTDSEPTDKTDFVVFIARKRLRQDSFPPQPIQDLQSHLPDGPLVREAQIFDALPLGGGDLFGCSAQVILPPCCDVGAEPLLDLPQGQRQTNHPERDGKHGFESVQLRHVADGPREDEVPNAGGQIIADHRGEIRKHHSVFAGPIIGPSHVEPGQEIEVQDGEGNVPLFEQACDLDGHGALPGAEHTGDEHSLRCAFIPHRPPPIR